MLDSHRRLSVAASHAPGDLTLAELLGALSYALDITEGQPEGHCLRACWIGMRIGRELGLPDSMLRDLYYTLLLKDAGCSSNAARICELYVTDDLRFKREFKWVDGSLPQIVRFALGNTGAGLGFIERLKLIAGSLESAEASSQELITTRCERGASIARRLRFSNDVSEGIRSLDEHWDGKGRPAGLERGAIPLYSRIALLAQVLEVFHASDGPKAALDEARRRDGTWFDPELVGIVTKIALDDPMWTTLRSPELERIVFGLEPATLAVTVDDDYLDEIAAAFGDIVDAKSPYTAGHSSRVAFYCDLLATELGLPSGRRRWLNRGALLHDIGKLGVSNAILDKPGKLDEAEWEAVKRHPVYTESILARIPHFAELAVVSAAHHERLDGKGYPRGIRAEEISIETRLITTVDIFDAITAERPYRGAIPTDRALAMMAESVGTAIDVDCFDALRRIVDKVQARAAA